MIAVELHSKLFEQYFARLSPMRTSSGRLAIRLCGVAAALLDLHRPTHIGPQSNRARPRLARNLRFGASSSSPEPHPSREPTTTASRSGARRRPTARSPARLAPPVFPPSPRRMLDHGPIDSAGAPRLTSARDRLAVAGGGRRSCSEGKNHVSRID